MQQNMVSDQDLQFATHPAALKKNNKKKKTSAVSHFDLFQVLEDIW